MSTFFMAIWLWILGMWDGRGGCGREGLPPGTQE